ncbi:MULTISPECIES: hypothetical protein [Bradyrhizobium]|uniref:Uncharacterized protein n=1 Tax=Bradyrhizobium arachidis TaxID=858423 RepID=A0AAE7NI16_9BRAD|nr:hypothetical protein [Bradyrhizobium arachidis]QOZ66389.1 hypothetical protein WN72_08210 [Bradyrhizobium arachidis]SFV18322.1 hypothetical protein SAMN05192541_13439 [Bradyrhizobium arachidis]
MSIINFADRRKTEPCVVDVDRTLVVHGREYTLRRSSWRGNKTGGWVGVRDSEGRMMFVRGGNPPDSLIVELIGAWVDGYGVGRKEAAKAAARGYTGDIV